jgi:hypothetical protein
VSVNRFLPHVLVLPEDDANRQLAVGFQLNVSVVRQMQILEVAGGWTEVLRLFASVHVKEMERDENRVMVLLIDFDGKPDRLEKAKTFVPEHLMERVFVLGALTDPETLRASLGPYEEIGSALAEDCREGTNTTWGHELLQHNAQEVARLRATVRQILF